MSLEENPPQLPRDARGPAKSNAIQQCLWLRLLLTDTFQYSQAETCMDNKTGRIEQDSPLRFTTIHSQASQVFSSGEV